jgi:hypothetical protein
MSALFQSLSIGGSSREGSGKFAKSMWNCRKLDFYILNLLFKLSGSKPVVLRIKQIGWLIMRDNAICTCIHLRDLQEGRTCYIEMNFCWKMDYGFHSFQVVDWFCLFIMGKPQKMYRFMKFNNYYVKLDIEWNISDFIFKEI